MHFAHRFPFRRPKKDDSIRTKDLEPGDQYDTDQGPIPMTTTPSVTRVVAILVLAHFTIGSPLSAVGRPAAPRSGTEIAERPGHATARETVFDTVDGPVSGVGFRTPSDSVASSNDDTAFGIVFPYTADGTYAVRSRAVTIAYTLRGARASTAEITRGKVAYREVFPGVDSVHRLDPTRSEEFLVLRNQEAPTEYDYDLHLSEGVSVEQRGDGGLRFDVEGREVEGESLSIEAPYAVDADGRRSTTAARYEIDAVPGRATLRLIVDTTGLRMPLVVDPSWVLTATMATSRDAHEAVWLGGGKALAIGGQTDSTPSPTRTCEIYASSTNAWTATGSLKAGRAFHRAVVLGNGKVLVTGGLGTTGTAIASCEIYTPSTGTWAYTGSMAAARAEHTATLLADGRVLVAGGYNGTPRASLTKCEVYDPTNGSWSLVGDMPAAVAGHTATRMVSSYQNVNGRVLVTGGITYTAAGGSFIPLFASEFNPATNAWATPAYLTPPADMARYNHSATQLGIQQILVACGRTSAGLSNTYYLFDEVEYGNLRNPWRLNSHPFYLPRERAAIVTISGGALNSFALVIGGFDAAGNAVSDVALYNWSTNNPGLLQWTAMQKSRGRHAAVTLGNGRILVCGGYNSTNGSLKAGELMTIP